MSFVDTFLHAIRPFHHAVVVLPLATGDVEKIERALGNPLPPYYREFLLKVGLKQDVIHGLHNQLSDFDNLDNLLPENRGHRFFRFGDNGGDDYWLLRIDDPADMTIYRYDQYDTYQIVSMHKTFEQLLLDAVEQLKLNKTRLVENHRKVWRVQFAVDTGQARNVVDALASVFHCALLADPDELELTADGVSRSDGCIMINDASATLRIQDAPQWGTPSYYFSWEEPVADMIGNSMIRRIEAALLAGGLDTTVIDYGITVKDKV